MNNNYYKKLQIFRKDWKYFLSFLSFFLLFIINYKFTLVFATEEMTDDIIDISIMQIEKNLGSFEEIPKSKEILDRLQKQNKNLEKKINYSSLEAYDISFDVGTRNGKAFIKTLEKNKKFQGKIEVLFSIPQVLDTLILNKELGELELIFINQQSPTTEDFLKAVKNKNNIELIKEEIDFEISSEKGKITIKAQPDSTKYKGKVKLNFKIKAVDKEEIKQNIINEVKKNFKIPIDSDLKEEELEKRIQEMVAQETEEKNATKESILRNSKNFIYNVLHDKKKEIGDLEQEHISENNIQRIVDAPKQEKPTLPLQIIQHETDTNDKYFHYIVIVCIILIAVVFAGLLILIFKKRNNLKHLKNV